MFNHRLFLYTPSIGVVIFMILLWITTALYPGGSSAYPQAEGFSWIHNYWCDLLREHAKNGELNTGRPIAFAAIISLCLALAFFWYQIPRYLRLGKIGFYVIRYLGVLAMLLTIFIFSDWHDLVIDVATIAGGVALLGVYVGLYRSRAWWCFAAGLFFALLMALTNYIYRTEHWIELLPLVLKIASFGFLAWIVMMNFLLFGETAKRL